MAQWLWMDGVRLGRLAGTIDGVPCMRVIGRSDIVQPVEGALVGGLDDPAQAGPGRVEVVTARR